MVLTVDRFVMNYEIVKKMYLSPKFGLFSNKIKKQLAEMLKKDKKNYSSTLQLLSDRDVLIDVSFDAFCEYTGNIDNQYDY